jgi:hypothetical protein
VSGLLGVSARSRCIVAEVATSSRLMFAVGEIRSVRSSICVIITPERAQRQYCACSFALAQPVPAGASSIATDASVWLNSK